MTGGSSDRGIQPWAALGVLATVVSGLAIFVGLALAVLSPLASDPCGPDDVSFICTSVGQTRTLLIGLAGTAVLGIGSLVVGWTRKAGRGRGGVLAAGAALTVVWVVGYSSWLSSLIP